MKSASEHENLSSRDCRGEIGLFPAVYGLPSGELERGKAPVPITLGDRRRVSRKDSCFYEASAECYVRVLDLNELQGVSHAIHLYRRSRKQRAKAYDISCRYSRN